jgi:prolyl-tRNA editing enzyme YbaK/EbsC (Cys-tRNA(Pro) deacylase)
MAITRAGKLLEEHGLWYREFDREEHRENVCKTIMFKRRDGGFVAVLVPLAYRVSYKKLKAHYGQDVSPLSPDELRTIGFEPGECAPMLMPCELIVDPSCLVFEIIHSGSGTLGKGVEWNRDDLEKLKPYTLMVVGEPPATQ